MNKTSLSLLDRVCSGAEQAAWERLVDVYVPLLQQWLSRYDLQTFDAEDLIQEVMATAYRELPKFEHNGRQGAFRKWLKTILVYRLRSFWRDRNYRPLIGGGTDFQRHLQEFEDPTSGLSRLWDREHDRVVLQQLWEVRRGQQQRFTIEVADGCRLDDGNAGLRRSGTSP